MGLRYQKGGIHSSKNKKKTTRNREDSRHKTHLKIEGEKMNNHSQIRIVLNTGGMEKIELFALPEDDDSEELAIGLYNKLAIAIQ